MEDKKFVCWLNIIEAECNVDYLAGGGDRPLGEKLPDRYEVKASNGYTGTLTNGLELHRLVVEGYDQLERRSKELDKKIIDAKCSEGTLNKVSEPTSLSLLPRWRHCFSPADPTPPTPPSSFSASAPIPTSPLHWAALHNNPAVCRSLLASGAKMDAGSTWNINILHFHNDTDLYNFDTIIIKRKYITLNVLTIVNQLNIVKALQLRPYW